MISDNEDPIIPDQEKSRSTAKKIRNRQIVMIVICILSVFAVIFAELSFNALSRAFTRENKDWYRVGFLAFTLLSGYLLFRIKQRRQMEYGMIAFTTGIFLCAELMLKSLKENPSMMGIMIPCLVAVYCASRGYQNFYEGLEKLKNEDTEE